MNNTVLSERNLNIVYGVLNIVQSCINLIALLLKQKLWFKVTGQENQARWAV